MRGDFRLAPGNPHNPGHRVSNGDKKHGQHADLYRKDKIDKRHRKKIKNGRIDVCFLPLPHYGLKPTANPLINPGADMPGHFQRKGPRDKPAGKTPSDCFGQAGINEQVDEENSVEGVSEFSPPLDILSAGQNRFAPQKLLNKRMPFQTGHSVGHFVDSAVKRPPKILKGRFPDLEKIALHIGLKIFEVPR